MKKTFENLMAVHFDGASDLYELEFQENGNSEFIQVKASDHPEAATDEFYFDNKEVVNKIIAEAE